MQEQARNRQRARNAQWHTNAVAEEEQAKINIFRRGHAERMAALKRTLEDVHMVAFLEARIPENIVSPHYILDFNYKLIRCCKLFAMMVVWVGLYVWQGQVDGWKSGILRGWHEGYVNAAKYSHDHPQGWKTYVRSVTR